VFPACIAVSVHVPLLPVMVTVAPLMEHAPDAPMETGKPELAVALAAKVPPYGALVGVLPNVMVWLAIVTVSFVLASLAGPKMASPAKL
jgi:Na+/H+ antiporter NhaD/arsenite permease-like protein